MNESILKNFMRDTVSLKQYYDNKDDKNKTVKIEDLKIRLFIIQRNMNTNIPDHYYLKEYAPILDSFNNFPEFFTKAIPNFAAEYLTMNQNGTVSVKEDRFIEWQDLITVCSPLLLVSSFLFKEKSINLSCTKIVDYFKEYIKPNTKNTALIGPEIITLNKFFKDKGGVSDLHIHLNGIIEADAVWQNLLSETDKNISNINSSLDKETLKQALEQLNLYKNSDSFTGLLTRAKELREILLDFIVDQIQGTGKKSKQQKNAPFFKSYSGLHPFSIFIEDELKVDIPNQSLRYEALMYILILHFLSIKNNKKATEAANNFHEYLLINGFFSSFCVQNMEEKGFEQFQAKTKNKIYRICDTKYISKFLQLGGNRDNYFKFIEFRLSPEEFNEISCNNFITELNHIDTDWEKFLDTIRQLHKDKKKSDYEYRLIAHFIKYKDNKSNNNVAFYDLRKKLESQTNTLIYVHNLSKKISNKLIGIDAAASEFDTPPEIFAPYYRKLRKKGFNHFTYHAGEDFYHVLSGLRAIYEAVEFCDLHKGNRIGHGTAAGIPIKEWINIIGDDVYIPIGEYMDDLLFCYYFIFTRNIDSLTNKLIILEHYINNYYYRIYEKSFNIQEIINAWKARRLEVDTTSCFLKIINDNENIILNDKVQEILEDYNNIEYRKKYNEAINVPILEIFDIEQLTTLQKEILKYLHENEIVIETLPTSNVRIGFHKSFDTYQLFNWFDWYTKGVALPPIVLGTDDPGIFQTNIFNEYAIIFCYLAYNKYYNRNDIINFIEELYKNGENYKFYD